MYKAFQTLQWIQFFTNIESAVITLLTILRFTGHLSSDFLLVFFLGVYFVTRIIYTFIFFQDRWKKMEKLDFQFKFNTPILKFLNKKIGSYQLSQCMLDWANYSRENNNCATVSNDLLIPLGTSEQGNPQHKCVQRAYFTYKGIQVPVTCTGRQFAAIVKAIESSKVTWHEDYKL